jgi:hypothetical protein
MAYIIHGSAGVENLPQFMDSRRRPMSEILPYLMGQPAPAELEDELRNGLRRYVIDMS